MRILCGKSAALGQSKCWQSQDKLVQEAFFMQVGSLLQTKSSFPVCRMEIALPASEGCQENTLKEGEAAKAMFRLLVP